MAQTMRAPTHQARAKRAFGLTMALAAAAVSLLALDGCKKPAASGPAPAAKPALTVTVATVENVPLARKIDASGSVAAWQQVPVASETGGLEVTAVLVDEGSRVRQGQALIQLDDRVLRAQVRQAQASVASTRAVLAQNEAALRRAQELHGKGYLSQSALDKATADARTAEAQVQTAQAGLGEAQAKLSQASVRAPVAGLITARSVVKGQVISVGTELFRLVREGQLEMNAQVPQSDLPLVRAGQAATVTSEEGATVIGRVRLVTPQVDPQTRLGLARITLPQGSPFKSGNYARATIDVGVVPALVAPQNAVVFREGKPGLYVLNAAGRVHFHAITTGTRSGDLVEVTSGGEAGSRVAVGGAGFLGENDLVRVAGRVAGAAR